MARGWSWCSQKKLDFLPHLGLPSFQESVPPTSSLVLSSTSLGCCWRCLFAWLNECRITAGKPRRARDWSPLSFLPLAWLHQRIRLQSKLVRFACWCGKAALIENTAINCNGAKGAGDRRRPFPACSLAWLHQRIRLQSKLVRFAWWCGKAALIESTAIDGNGAKGAGDCRRLSFANLLANAGPLRSVKLACWCDKAALIENTATDGNGAKGAGDSRRPFVFPTCSQTRARSVSSKHVV